MQKIDRQSDVDRLMADRKVAVERDLDREGWIDRYLRLAQGLTGELPSVGKTFFSPLCSLGLTRTVGGVRKKGKSFPIGSLTPSVSV